MNIQDILSKELGFKEICSLLSISDPDEEKALFEAAYAVKEAHVGKKVYFRGLIEYSNKCNKNCFYCGIRKDNEAQRYEMTEDEVLECAHYAKDSNYGSIVLQSGEIPSTEYVDKICRVLRRIKKETGDTLGITLCIGELTEAEYRKLFEAGAHRYLLRIETSSEELYRKLHPFDHSYHKRIECLRTLQKIGFQTGTGVMIGLPFQTVEDLAGDILFFKEMDIDMIGMGPYIEHEDTPLYEYKDMLLPKKERMKLALRMIAVLRIVMKDVNIAATTALQSIDPIGREKGLLAGANVIMPNLTPTRYRKDYLLYENKPCLDESKEMCSGCLKNRIEGIGEEVALGQWGDPVHFFKRTGK